MLIANKQTIPSDCGLVVKCLWLTYAIVMIGE
uniref:Uncharacterized protein n=1 Tax=Arundo donax TaxID=35708 RepID=A0A0A8ZU39_ARUDO